MTEQFYSMTELYSYKGISSDEANRSITEFLEDEIDRSDEIFIKVMMRILDRDYMRKKCGFTGFESVAEMNKKYDEVAKMVFEEVVDTT